ncbi:MULTISPECIES: sulfite exporter TauE/SafE family protein [Tepidiforma]|uniref:sulfite exporter TauE/SafE family protein n=1 Tax=Tepidiforma TaxID=2682228 RepID=UPI001CE445F6|nr:MULTISPECIES: sulfite exporter TauE/SafE family protein [Tepidiforma]
MGFAVGAFGTLVGAGGGFVLVPILLLLYPEKDPETITAISLLVVCANAASGSVAYGLQGRIDYRSGWWFVLGTFPGAVAGAIVVGYVPRRLFDAIFAVLLGVVGVYLLARPQVQAIAEPIRGRGVVRRVVRDAHGNTFVYSYQLWKGVLISTAVGFISSLLGIGGGIIHVPIMATVLHFPVHIAAATSHFVLAFMAAEGTAVHILQGVIGWDRSLAQGLLLAAGAIPGAQVGARLAHRLHGGIILRALAGALLLVALRLGVKAAGM